MSVTTAIAIYFLIWWVTLFAILPFGVRPAGESKEVPGADPGAPILPRILAKLTWNTAVSGVIFGLLYWIYTSGLVTLDDLGRWLGLPF